jgi:hypothetical protein
MRSTAISTGLNSWTNSSSNFRFVALIEFVQQLTAVSHGRAFYTTPEHLGRYVIEDYVSNRKRRAA